ncbi:MAG: PAAR domain-containing protein [Scytonema sp. PMC 1069.18]|nr:PAAR domain-containing protein [Scytonema sp. PMC 1069.18]MEC4880037.1 PAAR domain-containing protein [Scytonema sp. PMC 1070.18]
MSKAAARLTDSVAHPLPPVLTGGPGSLNVLIGSLPAWRGIPAGAVAGLQAQKKAADIAIKSVEAASKAAAGTPAAPGAIATEQNTKISLSSSMSSSIMSSAGGADIHNCTTPLPIPPHGPGVVIDGSKTVLINGLPACRMGDTILEALGPSNKITGGCQSVLIGG